MAPSSNADEIWLKRDTQEDIYFVRLRFYTLIKIQSKRKDNLAKKIRYSIDFFFLFPLAPSFFFIVFTPHVIMGGKKKALRSLRWNPSWIRPSSGSNTRLPSPFLLIRIQRWILSCMLLEKNHQSFLPQSNSADLILKAKEKIKVEKSTPSRGQGSSVGFEVMIKGSCFSSTFLVPQASSSDFISGVSDSAPLSSPSARLELTQL